jgi:hypothetical protein
LTAIHALTHLAKHVNDAGYMIGVDMADNHQTDIECGPIVTELVEALGQDIAINARGPSVNENQTGRGSAAKVEEKAIAVIRL